MEPKPEDRVPKPKEELTGQDFIDLVEWRTALGELPEYHEEEK